MIVEIVNPSDFCTFEGDNLEHLALAVLLLGEGSYGLRELGAPDNRENLIVPVFFRDGALEWYQEKFGRTLEEGLDASTDELIKIFDSFLYGRRDEYAQFVANAVTEEEKNELHRKWMDQKRSSMTNIGKNAAIYARKFREIAANRLVEVQS